MTKFSSWRARRCSATSSPGEGTAFWYNSVCRGEMQSVRIGKRCNIQDLALIHNKVTIGDDVSVGHCAPSTARPSATA